MRKGILILYIMLLCLVLMAGCGKPGATDNTSPPEETVADIEIAADGTTGYVIIYATDHEEAEGSSAAALYNAFSEKLGTPIEFKLDLIRESAGFTEIETEIVVGTTNRTATLPEAVSSLKFNDFYIGMSEKKLYIIGGSPEATLKATEYFIESYISEANDGVLKLPGDLEYIYRQAYPIDSVKVCGKELGSAGVYCGESPSDALVNRVGALIEAFAERSGVRLTLTETPSDNSLFVGTVQTFPEYSGLVGENAAVLTAKDGRAVLTANDEISLFRAINGYIEILKTNEENVMINEAENTYTLENSGKISVMTYNVLTTRVDTRKDAVGALILSYMPDVLGTQEGNDKWNAYFDTLFDGIYEGTGKASEEEGYSASYDRLFYNKKRFELIEDGTFWLSATPEVPGSKFSESKRVRMATYALLKLKATGEEILFVNTHLDNLSDTPRLLQAEVLLSFTDKYNCPTVLVGDFNSKMSSGVYNNVTAENGQHRGFDDPRQTAEKSIKYGTYNGFGASTGTSVIDYCFLSRGDFKANYYLVVTEFYNGIQPSDHNAVYIECETLKSQNQ